MSEWIEWKGGECPVDGREYIEFKCPNDDKIYAHNACGLRWEHIGHGDDIIVYRVAKSPTA